MLARWVTMTLELVTSSKQVAEAYKATADYAVTIGECHDSNQCLSSTDASNISKTVGKVRDIYVSGSTVALVATDRQSAFDRHLASVPFKGQVLSRVSQWWFQKTAHIVPNHVIAVPHPNITVGSKCDIFPIEFVVRAYITGSTDTAIWTHYNKGVRDYCGHKLPDGLVKNQKLDATICTPTTKVRCSCGVFAPERAVGAVYRARRVHQPCGYSRSRIHDSGQTSDTSNTTVCMAEHIP